MVSRIDSAEELPTLTPSNNKHALFLTSRLVLTSLGILMDWVREDALKETKETGRPAMAVGPSFSVIPINR
jgi:hypothetical protein